MYDPRDLGERVSRVVSRGSSRKYYRFRPARFYGGIATADCLGCPLRCMFCWAWKELVRIGKIGKFYSPGEVASTLLSIARKKGFDRIRISGNEPTLNKTHLVEVIERIPREYTFILETNGILIAGDDELAGRLSRFPNLSVRVSMKGCSSGEFSMLTGADPSGFELQNQALRDLLEHGVDCWPAVMTSFSSMKNVDSLRKRLGSLRDDFASFEEEELVLYPHVQERLERCGIDYHSSHLPDRIPGDQV